jgi:hypothetical protein
MSEQFRGPIAEVGAAEGWRRWQGQTVNGEFQLREYLGGSAHSAVFLTEYDHREPQRAAIKLIPENAPEAQRQLQSWQAAVELSHPNLIRIFQLGRCEIEGKKLLYLIMECADENLAQILPQRALSAAEATEMLPPTLEALRYLHQKGWIHGSIKPANIMACGDQLKLSADGLREPGERIGAPGCYAPPEGSFSPLGDVWSLGMTLVEVLTQHRPGGDPLGDSDPEVPGSLPKPLFDIARNCLRRDLRKRWTVRDIANKLDPAARAAVQKIEQIVRPEQPRAKRKYLVAAVIFALAVIGFVAWKSRSHSRSGAAVAPTEQPLAQAAVPVRDLPPSPQVKPGGTKGPDSASRTARDIAAPSVLPSGEAADIPASRVATGRAGGVLHQVLPDVPQRALDTIRGTVKVGIIVSVNDAGSVTHAAIDSPGPSPYFANLALRAAPQWRFATAPGVAGDWILNFDFSNRGIETSARKSAL